MTERVIETQLLPVIHWQPNGAKPYSETERKQRRQHLQLERVVVKQKSTLHGVTMVLYEEKEVIASNAFTRQTEKDLDSIPRSPKHYAIDLLDNHAPDYDRTMFRTECIDEALDRWAFYTEDIA